jgi:hypothetical protein
MQAFAVRRGLVESVPHRDELSKKLQQTFDSAWPSIIREAGAYIVSPEIGKMACEQAAFNFNLHRIESSVQRSVHALPSEMPVETAGVEVVKGSLKGQEVSVIALTLKGDPVSSPDAERQDLLRAMDIVLPEGDDPLRIGVLYAVEAARAIQAQSVVAEYVPASTQLLLGQATLQTSGRDRWPDRHIL